MPSPEGRASRMAAKDPGARMAKVPKQQIGSERGASKPASRLAAPALARLLARRAACRDFAAQIGKDEDDEAED